MLKKITTSRGSAYAWALALLLTLGVAGETLQAQSNNDRSPYSRFGYGTLGQSSTAGARALGGLGIGLRDPMLTNPLNPASYTAVDSMTFLMDIGFSLRTSILSEGKHSDSKTLGNLDYVTMIFPMGKRVAFSAGMMPLGTTGYSFGNTAGLGGDKSEREALRTYQGTGNYNNLYIGLGARPLEHLSLGLNGAFVFGHTTHTRQVTYFSSGAFNSVFSEELALRGLKLDAGAQYEFRLDTLDQNSHSLVVGATFSPQVSFDSERTRVHRLLSSSGSGELMHSDTIKNRPYSLPTSMGFGLSYRIGNKLMVGSDVQYSKWSEARFDDHKAQFQDQWRVAVGAEWIPNYRARSPFQRARYRFGLSGANSYMQVPTTMNQFSGYYEFGATAGLGLPLVDRRSMLNINLDYKHLMPKVNGMIREHYLGLNLGISFNEGWFRKSRVD
ncbi:MAG: hypothetical protein Q4A64_07920 [Porphyromonadaceae bacterium]|nr:hypothetical protein [Porphyromonadaceae bacterium]